MFASTTSHDGARGSVTVRRGSASPRAVGIWLELSDASLADAHGEGLIRWVRALISGFDQVPEVGTIVIPCAVGSRHLVERLFAADEGPADGPRALVSTKLHIMAVGRDQRRALELRAWFGRRRKAWQERLAGYGVSTNPLTWAVGQRPLVATIPSSLGLLLAIAGRLRRTVMATVGLGMLEVLRPLLPRGRPVFEDIAADLHGRTGDILWIVPDPGWEAALGLPGRLVVNVADIVYREYPLLGVPPATIRAHQRGLAALAERAEAVVCFSEYVARRQVRPALAGSERPVVVVPHAPLVTPAADVDEATSRRHLARDLRRHFATSVQGGPHRFFCDFPFERVDYLLVSSKCRPYKNYAGAIDAYECVLRRHRRDVKLVVTGALSSDPALGAELARRGLVFDVVEATNLPEPIHARLLRHARALVIPTFFEGAMPFGFAEAVGVGTPVAFSRIPVVEELLTDAELAAPEAFVPADVDGMVSAILHVLDHPAEVLARQRLVYARLGRRTWADVARDYLACGEASAAPHSRLRRLLGGSGASPRRRAG